MIRPIINIVLLITIFLILYTCSCRMQKKTQRIAPLMAKDSEHQYPDPDLVATNELNVHMKPSIKDQSLGLTDSQTKAQQLVSVKDYRFVRCGETLQPDPRTEHKNFDKPLSLMKRINYRQQIKEPALRSLEDIPRTRGHKSCKLH